MELMLHRRLLVDDHWGVGEALNETAYGKGLVARGKHYLLFDTSRDEAFRRQRLLSNELYAFPLVTFDTADVDDDELFMNKPQHTSSSSIPTAVNLPPNTNLLSMESISHNKEPYIPNLFLIRLEHLFDVGEHANLSLPVQVNFKDFVEDYFGRMVKSVEEMTLGGNFVKEMAIRQRLHWTKDLKNQLNEVSSKMDMPGKIEFLDDFSIIELKPMEIRTFQVELW